MTSSFTSISIIRPTQLRCLFSFLATFSLLFLGLLFWCVIFCARAPSNHSYSVAWMLVFKFISFHSYGHVLISSSERTRQTLQWGLLYMEQWSYRLFNATKYWMCFQFLVILFMFVFLLFLFSGIGSGSGGGGGCSWLVLIPVLCWNSSCQFASVSIDAHFLIVMQFFYSIRSSILGFYMTNKLYKMQMSIRLFNRNAQCILSSIVFDQ